MGDERTQERFDQGSEAFRDGRSFLQDTPSESAAWELGLQDSLAKAEHLAPALGSSHECFEAVKPKIGDYSLYGNPEHLEGKSWAAHGGKVKVQKRIDKGGNAFIYACQFEKQGSPQPMILKVMRLEGNPEDLEFRRTQFMKERSVMQSCVHPNVAKIIAHGQAGSDPQITYLLMPHYRGGSLFQYINIIQGASLSELLGFLEKLNEFLKGLQYFHLKTYMAHLDIGLRNVFVEPGDEGLSPEEVLFHPKTKLILGDFGNVKSYIHPEDLKDVDLELEGDEEFYACSPHSAAPEQALKTKKNLRITPNTDLWSFGVMLYELFSGKTIFDMKDESFSKEEREAFDKMSQENRPFAQFQLRLAKYYQGEITIPDLQQFCKENPLPEPLVKLIMKTWLHPEPKQRKGFQASALLEQVMEEIRSGLHPEESHVHRALREETPAFTMIPKDTPSRSIFGRIIDAVSSFRKTG